MQRVSTALDWNEQLPANVRVISELPADYAAFNLTDPRGVQRLSEAEARHFWFQSRNEFISKQLRKLGCMPPARLLELGCGGGVVCAHLARLGFEITGVDGHRARVVEAARRTPQGFFFVHDLGNGTPSLEALAFDAVGLFDVIEHLEKPGDALVSALGCARPGGLVIGTVPALMSLWSEADEHAGHRLRYEPAALRRLLNSIPGASLIEILSFNRALVPMLFLQRRLFRNSKSELSAGLHLKVPPAPLNRAFAGLLRLERSLGSALNRLRLPGASLWFALRKDSPKSIQVPADPS